MTDADKNFIIWFSAFILMSVFAILLYNLPSQLADRKEKALVTEEIVHQISTNSKSDKHFKIELKKQTVQMHRHAKFIIETYSDNNIDRFSIKNVLETTDSTIVYFVNRYHFRSTNTIDGDYGEEALGLLYFSIPFW